MPLTPVTLSGNYFSARGRRFFPIGAHWVPARAAMQWPTQWDAAELEADFAKMSDLGFNTMRFDLLWAWFEPRPGDYHPEAFRQFDFFVQLAHRFGIYLHPTLFIGGEVGEAFWDVPWRQGRHPHADPDMLRLQTDHAAEFARRYHGESAILAWDLTDEPPFWIVGGETSDAMAINWTRLVSGAFRRYDPWRLLCVGTSLEDLARGPFRPDNLAAEVDFFSVHPYSIYAPQHFPDPMLSERGTYCGAFQVALSAGAGRPVMVHEFGASSAQYSPERIAAFDRVTMYSTLAAGACGFLPWCYTDAAPETFHRLPYLRAPHETQFGLTTHDRQDRPRGRELRAFSQLLQTLDLQGLEPAPAEAALVVPHEWAAPQGDFSRLGLQGAGAIPYTSSQEKWDSSQASDWLIGALLSAFILARRAGLKADLPREYAGWESRPLLLLPSPLTSTAVNIAHLHTTFWERARAYVQAGGALYASLCADAAIPEMGELFGAALADHAPADEVTLTMVAPFGDPPGGLQPGEVFRFRADPHNPRHWPAVLDLAGGQTIAVDQAGRPALVAHTCGRGQTLLSAYPLESYLAATPSAFEDPASAPGAGPAYAPGTDRACAEGAAPASSPERLYRALCRRAGLVPLFSTDQPGVEVSALLGAGRGYAVLANHRPAACEVTVTARPLLRSAMRIGFAGRTPLPLAGNGWQIEVPAYGGAVVEWESA